MTTDRARIWHVTVGGRDPQDDYVIKVKACDEGEARMEALAKMTEEKHIKRIDPARRRKP